MGRHARLRLEQLERRQMFSVTISGDHSEQILLTDPGNGAIVNLTGGRFFALEDTHFPAGEPLPAAWPARDTNPQWESSNEERYPVSIRGTSSSLVINGGSITGQMDPRAPWHVWKGYSDGAGLRVEGSGTYEIKNTFIKNVEDGIDPRGSAGAEFNIHDVYMTQIHDDMVENDAIHSGVIRDSFMRGHTFLSARGTVVGDATAVVQVRNVVVELMLQPHAGDHGPDDINTAGGYPFPDGLGTGTLFKWQENSGTVDVRDSVFLIDRVAASSMKAMEFPPGVYSNVTIVWLGAGAYPPDIPPGVTVTRNRLIYDDAVDAFFAAHPQFTRDPLDVPPWLNLDVSGNGRVAPQDALLIINQLIVRGAYAVDVHAVPRDRRDVNLDGLVQPRDVLMVINFLETLDASPLARPAAKLAQPEATAATVAGAEPTAEAAAQLAHDATWSEFAAWSEIAGLGKSRKSAE